MNTIFTNSENSKTSKAHILMLKLTNELDLRMGEKIIALSNLSIYYTWKNIKSSYNNNKFKISAPTWNDKIQVYFDFIVILSIMVFSKIQEFSIHLFQINHLLAY